MKNTPPQILLNWADSIGARNPNIMTSFYTKNSVLLATYEDMCIGIDEIYAYFVEFLDKTGLNCQLLDNINQNDINSNTLISSGTYLFSFYDEEDNLQEVYARYSYVFRNNNIINHHSSLLPSQTT